MDTPFRIEHPSRNVHVVRMDPNAKEWWILCQSDEHQDNPDCDRSLLKKHHELALERQAPILKYGDYYCVMQGKFDRRQDRSKVRPEHQCGDYLDAIVRTGADLLEPYAHHIVMLGRGNHEQAIYKHHETDITERTCQVLRDRTGAPIQAGGYGGWIRLMFESPSRGRRRSINGHYFHGAGGGGPVTKGVIQTNRRQDSIYADFYLGGHVHEAWTVRRSRAELNNMNRVTQRDCLHVCTPGYKNEFKDGNGGWHVETGKPPKPKGCVWLRFERYGKAGDIHMQAIDDIHH